MAVLRRVSDDVPRPIREINPEVPDWLEAIVERLHAKDPADRFASASELADLLGQCLAHVQEPLTVALRRGADPEEGEGAAWPRAARPSDRGRTLGTGRGPGDRAGPHTVAAPRPIMPEPSSAKPAPVVSDDPDRRADPCGPHGP